MEKIVTLWAETREMKLPINIEELLNGHAVEGERIEYKTGWNPDAIYRTICAFANDFDETGGGYIVIGVKEENGRALRPVEGIDPNRIDPYQALEEAVVNSLYHRDWTIREPVEITIEPDRISILSFSGPDHTIPMEAVRKGKSLRSRRYRNRRLGEFLKELDLTEGRATGIPTIQDELQSNGSPQATIETDDARTYFLIDIPCHREFVSERVILNADFVKDFIKENQMQLSERQLKILVLIAEDSTLTSQKISQKTGVTQRTIQMDLADMQAKGILTRKGGRKEGQWEIAIL